MKLFSLCTVLFGLLFPNPALTLTIDGAFYDWTYQDLRALDAHWGMTLGEHPSYTPCYPIPDTPNGSDSAYLLNDGWDDSRDLVAFYTHDGGEEDGYYYFRIDFFDLKRFAEDQGGLDFYISINTRDGGQEWLPDFMDCKTDTPWEITLAVYDTLHYAVYDDNFSTLPVALTGPAYNSEQDSVELGVPRQTLLDAGWTGGRPLMFQVYTTKDGTGEGAGELGGTGFGPNNSDITDAFVDNDRGWGDGILNGSISESGGRSGRAKWVDLMHGNQSYNSESAIRARIDHATDPGNPVEGAGFYRALDTAEDSGVPVELHLSGILTHAIEWADPAFNARLKALRERGLVELLGGVYAEHIMPFFKGDVSVESIRLGTQAITDVYGIPSEEITIFWVPERVAREDTLADIIEANRRYGLHYKAVVLDENTAHHDWFGYDLKWDGIEGNEVRVDLDNDELKPHELNGLWIFFIDRYAQMWKVETMQPTFYDCDYEPSPMVGIRGKLLTLAQHADQEQVVVCMEDWEDWAGAPYRAWPNRRNPDGHDIVAKYFAQHPWIEVTTLTKIVAGGVDVDGDGQGDPWTAVTDQKQTGKLPPTFGLPMPPYWLNGQLPIESYTWVRDASEGNQGNDNPRPGFENTDNNPDNDDWDDGYQNWYWGSEWEESFKNAVPLLRGSRYFADAEPVPNGLKFGAMMDWDNGTETPSITGIIPQIWAAIAGSSGDASLLELAKYAFMAMIYETAWHDEATARGVSDEASADDQKGVFVSWLQPPMGKIRSAGKIVAAAEWAASNPPSDAMVEIKDLDLDGEDEYLLYNDKIYAVFENDGGRLVNLFTRDPVHGAVALVGAEPAFPDREGEEENTDEWTSDDHDYSLNRCTALRDQGYVNDLYTVTASGNRLVLVSSDLKVKKFVTLRSGASELEVRYDVSALGGALNVEIGASPNVLDLVQHGKTHLRQRGCAGCQYFGFENSEGGGLFATLDEVKLAFSDDLDRDNTLAMTGRMVLQGSGTFRFNLTTTRPDAGQGPSIPAAGFVTNPLSSKSGGMVKLCALVTHPDGPEAVASVDVSYEGTRGFLVGNGAVIGSMRDNGTGGDDVAGDGVYTWSMPLPAGVPAGDYLLSITAKDVSGTESAKWPYLALVAAPAASRSGLKLQAPKIQSEALNLLLETLKTPLYRAAVGGSPAILAGGYVYDYTDRQQQRVVLWNYIGGGYGAEAEVLYAGQPLGLALGDAGNQGDSVAGDDIFTLSIATPYSGAGEYLLEVEAQALWGSAGPTWPYLTIGDF